MCPVYVAEKCGLVALRQRRAEFGHQEPSMSQMFKKLWNDDRGALISTEFLLVATILVIGLVVGLSYVRNAVSSKLSELAQAITYLNVSYYFPGIEGNYSQNGALAGTAGTNVLNQIYPLMPTQNIAAAPMTVFDDPQN